MNAAQLQALSLPTDVALRVPPGGSWASPWAVNALSVVPPNGAAYGSAGFVGKLAGAGVSIRGSSVSVEGRVHIFTPSTATWRALGMNGTVLWIETQLADPMPTPPYGRVLFGCTITDGTGIAYDRVFVGDDKF